MRLHRAKLISRTLKDGNEVVVDYIPLGTEYIVDLDTITEFTNIETGFAPYRTKVINIIEPGSGFFMMELLEIDEGEYVP